MDGLSEDEIIHAVVGEVRNLARTVGIPEHLSEIGVNEVDIPLLSKKAIEDPCTGGNPRETSVDEIAAIYREAM